MIDALPLLLGPEGYQISRSVRLRSSASGNFTRTFTTPTSRRIFTFSSWLKRGQVGTNSFLFGRGTGPESYLTWISDSLEYYDYTGSAYSLRLITSQVFRDPSAWYHIVLSVDTTQATASNRVKLYVNGIQVTAFSTSTYPSQNFDTNINTSATVYLGRAEFVSNYFDGYLTEVNFIDGQALTPSSFGETDAVTGVWQPKKYAGTYGTNGFYLNFSDNSAATAAAIGADYSGNGNDWTPNNISVTAGVTYDSMLDVPTLWADGGNGRGNYAVLNPLDKSSGVTVADGNLKASNGAAYQSVRASTTFPASSKIYFEGVVGSATTGGVLIGFGICTAATNLNTAMGGSTGNYAMTGAGTANLVVNGVAGSSISTFTAGELIQCAVDTVNGKVWLGRSNVWYNSTAGTNGDPASGANPTFTVDATNMFPVSQTYSNNLNFNFGQRPFTYTPPSGFKALNTLNLPEPTILKGNQYFDINLWTGNGTSQTIVNSGGFAPDLVWFKSRSSGALWNVLCDTVRGATKELYSNATNAETTDVTDLTSFNSNGFSVGSGNGANQNAGTYVGWQWKEGPTQGFDIVTYTGTGVARTVSHSLGVAPSMMIVKRRNTTSDWIVWHSAFAGTEYIALNSTAAKATGATIWNSTSPTSSVFSVGTSGATNGNTDTYVAYCFSEVAGFSKFGSYTGNGSANGPFIFTGFRPRWIMWKKTNSATNAPWVIVDTSRSPYNLAREYLLPNASDAETSVDLIDVLSNGFKWRGTAPGGNASGDTYIYAAFCESPFKNSLAR